MGVLTTIVSGLLVSVITGGCKQEEMNSELFVRKNDLICFSWCNKSKESDITEKPSANIYMGDDNPAFKEDDMMSKDVEKNTKL